MRRDIPLLVTSLRVSIERLNQIWSQDYAHRDEGAPLMQEGSTCPNCGNGTITTGLTTVDLNVISLIPRVYLR